MLRPEYSCGGNLQDPDEAKAEVPWSRRSENTPIPASCPLAGHLGVREESGAHSLVLTPIHVHGIVLESGVEAGNGRAGTLPLASSLCS